MKNRRVRKLALRFLFVNWDLSRTLVARTKAVVLLRFFKSGRLRGASAKTAFSFCKAFSFGPLSSKEKALKNL